MGLYMAVFCSVDLCVYVYPGITLSSCTIVQNQEAPYLHLCSSLSRLLYLFKVFWGVIWILAYYSGKLHWNYDTHYIKSVNHFGQYDYFNNVNCSNPYTWDIILFVSFPLSSINVSLFSVYRSFTSLVKFISKYFILFDVFEIELFSCFFFQIVCCKCLQTQLIFACYFVSCSFVEFIS